MASLSCVFFLAFPAANLLGLRRPRSISGSTYLRRKYRSDRGKISCGPECPRRSPRGKNKSRITTRALTRPPAATRLSLHPAITWIVRKTRSFPSLVHTRFGFWLFLQCREVWVNPNGPVKGNLRIVYDGDASTSFSGPDLSHISFGLGTR
jgi:hypothetical protein